MAKVERTAEQSQQDWERSVVDLLIEKLEIPNGDAQGFVEAHSFEMAQEWVKGSNPEATANRLIAL